MLGEDGTADILGEDGTADIPVALSPHVPGTCPSGWSSAQPPRLCSADLRAHRRAASPHLQPKLPSLPRPMLSFLSLCTLLSNSFFPPYLRDVWRQVLPFPSLSDVNISFYCR